MTAKLFESALGITDPWFVASVEFDEGAKTLTVLIDFKVGSRFVVSGHEGAHPVHDTVTKTYRHLNFFQHECHLQVRTPRVKLPNGSVRLVEPDFAGRLNGFTLLFEAFILMLSGQMPFAAVSRIVGESPHRVLAVCEKYVEMACGLADHSDVTALAIDETSRARGHSYVTLAADADARRVLFVTEGRDAKTIGQLADYLGEHGCPAGNITQTSIDMSPAFISGVTKHLPNARITFDKFHIIGHASTAVDKMRGIEQKTDKSLKGMRWTLLKDTAKLKPEAAADLDALIAKMAVKRTARAWSYKEQLREILERKQINVVRAMLEHWCNCVMRSKVEPMKEVAKMIRTHLEGIVAWAQTRQTNGFLEAINGLFQASKRRARGFTRIATIRTVIFLIAGKLDFHAINPHAGQPT
ncbi:MAG: transposase [Burkholderiales bacterium RIFCSPHIGHO2_12_FULL_61_11]|nr:MAG: transposase [Burkholderiales bacterium RIFCSPHIGHO2_12_FULL_61_11]